MSYQTMMLFLALFLVGLGLLLTGVNLLSDALKRLGSRAFRQLAVQYMTPRWKALLFGLGSGAALQSTSAALFILATLNSSGSVTVAQAISILTGFSVGKCLMPFLVSFKIRIAVFFLVGVSAIIIYFTKEDRLRNISSIAFGLGLIFFGIEMMLDGVRPLRDEPWFGAVLNMANDWPGLTLMVGAALGFIMQSSTTVVLVAIGLAKGGILSANDTFLMMYGAVIGSSAFFKMLLDSALSGSGRQLIRFVNLFHYTGAGLFIILYYIELYLKIPLVLALLARISPEPEVQAAWAFLLLNMSSALVYIAIHHPLVDWLARQLPATEAETLAKPQFLWSIRPDDPQVALELVRMEQFRQFEQIAALLPTLVKEARDGLDPKARLAALQTLTHEIDAALADAALLPMDAEAAEGHAVLQTRQMLFKQLMDSVPGLAQTIRQARTLPEIAPLSNSCLEAVDFLLQHAVFLTQTEAGSEMDQDVLYSDRGPQMRQLRETYLNEYRELTQEARACLWALTVGVDKCVWLLSRTLNLKAQF